MLTMIGTENQCCGRRVTSSTTTIEELAICTDPAWGVRIAEKVPGNLYADSP